MVRQGNDIERNKLDYMAAKARNQLRWRAGVLNKCDEAI
jgi:hypothetical protein